jgi:hypothetical protein
MTVKEVKGTEERKTEYLESLYESLATVVKTIDVDIEDFVQGLTEAYKQAKTPKLQHTRDSDEKTLMPAILAHWHSSPTYTDETGEPMKLRMHGKEESLEQLVKDAMKSESLRDVNYTLDDVLKSLIHGRSVVIGEDGLIRAISRTFLYNTGGGTVLAESVLRSTSEYMKVTSWNMVRDEDEEGYIQRTARTTNFPRARLKLLRSMLEGEGMEFLTSVDNYITEEGGEEDTVRVAVGMYMYSDAE